MGKVIDRLLASDEPSIRHKARVGVLGEDPGSAPIKALRREIRSSPRVERLLSSRLDDGRIAPADHVYRKWTGAHWILATLADQTASLHQLPVVLVTGLGSTEQVARGAEAGADEYIIKGEFDRERLLRAVRRLLP